MQHGHVLEKLNFNLLTASPGCVCVCVGGGGGGGVGPALEFSQKLTPNKDGLIEVSKKVITFLCRRLLVQPLNFPKKGFSHFQFLELTFYEVKLF